MRPRELHSEYYRDRNSESELCLDFPGDEVFIDGLHAMQTHFWNNNVTIDIPVVRVMNTAHFLAAYMFATTCSGDQTEYDTYANISLGRDKQLFKIAIIVLAAMLKRIGGIHAQQCRNMLLDNRDPDFDEGVTLYDRFLRSAEKRFTEEEFLIDTQAKIQQLQAENQQLIAENAQLKCNYRIMEEKYTQINIGTQNNNCTINNYYGQSSTTAQPDDIPSSVSSESNSDEEFKYIHVSVTDEAERAKIHKMMCNIVRLPRIQQVCDELYILMKNRKVLCTINPEAMLKELRRIGLPGEEQDGFSQKNFQHYYRAPKLD